MDIQRVAALAPAGLVAGIDHSEEMVRQASARNRVAIRAGRVDLRRGVMSDLPVADRTFDTVLIAVSPTTLANRGNSPVAACRMHARP